MAKRNRHPVTGCRVDSLFDDVWLISPEQLNARVQHLVKIDLHELVKMNREAEVRLEAEAAKPENQNKPKPLPYRLVGNTAVLQISGVTTKYPTSFQMIAGGTSTMMVQKALHHALANPDVQNIFLHVDGCPGGNASGAFDLADDIRAVSETKPVWAHIDDVGTSAGMLFPSQANHISANRNAQVGSIGVMSKLVDTSKMYEAKGIKVIPIVAGKLKGVGMEGVPISPEQIQEVEALVSDMNDLFANSISASRGITAKRVKEMEARVMLADRGLKLGLIDRVCSLETALAETVKGNVPKRPNAAPLPEPNNPAATRSRTMLKPEQLIQAKGLPGAAHISAENADEVLLQSATSMVAELGELRQFKQTAQTGGPAKIDPALAKGHIGLYLKGLELSVKEGLVGPGQRDVIKNYLEPQEGQFNLSAVQPDGRVMLSADVLEKVLTQNKPNGVSNELSGAQPAPRATPGEDKEAKLPTFERINEIRASNQLAPITREDFKKAYGG